MEGENVKLQLSNNMTIKPQTVAFLGLLGLLLQGCIAFPPLVQVEHKDSASSQEVLRRLDAIDHRLSKLEEKTQKPQ